LQSDFGLALSAGKRTYSGQHVPIDANLLSFPENVLNILRLVTSKLELSEIDGLSIDTGTPPALILKTGSGPYRMGVSLEENEMMRLYVMLVNQFGLSLVAHDGDLWILEKKS
jgi:hypothetical protein